MWSINNPDTKIGSFLNKVTDVFLLNLMWILLSFTIIGFGPATTALYHTLVKVVRKDAGTMLKVFLGSIRDSWKVTIPAGMITLLLLVSAYFVDIPNVYILFAADDGIQIMTGIFSFLKLLIAIGLAVYLFPLLSRFQIGFFKGLYFALILQFRHFFTTVICAVSIVAAILLAQAYPFLCVILPGPVYLGMSCMMEKIMLQYMEAEDKERDLNKDQWYLE